jgi:hypothetical protein
LRGTDRATQLITRVITLRNPIACALRGRLVAGILSLGFVRRRLTRILSELGVNYRGSPIVAEDCADSASWAGLHPGDRVPDVDLTPTSNGPRRLFEVLDGPGHTALWFDGTVNQAPSGPRSLQAVAAFVRQHHPERIRMCHVVASATETANAHDGSSSVPILDPDGRLHRHFDARVASLYLIRPDGYVGYRSQPPDAHWLAAYLERVFLGQAREPARMQEQVMSR